MNAKNLSEAQAICIRILDAATTANLIINNLEWEKTKEEDCRNAVDWINGRIKEDATRLANILDGAA